MGGGWQGTPDADWRDQGAPDKRVALVAHRDRSDRTRSFLLYSSCRQKQAGASGGRPSACQALVRGRLGVCACVLGLAWRTARSYMMGRAFLLARLASCPPLGPALPRRPGRLCAARVHVRRALPQLPSTPLLQLLRMGGGGAVRGRSSLTVFSLGRISPALNSFERGRRGGFLLRKCLSIPFWWRYFGSVSRPVV